MLCAHQDAELGSLGLRLYDQSTLESGIQLQVDAAMDKMEAKRQKINAEKRIRTLRNRVRSDEHRDYHPPDYLSWLVFFMHCYFNIYVFTSPNRFTSASQSAEPEVPAAEELHRRRAADV